MRFLWIVTIIGALFVSTEVAAQDRFTNIAKATLANQMRDPGSTRFRGLYVSRSSGEPILCGEFNSKNGYGAYAGFQPFVANDKGLAYFGDQLAPVWESMCIQKSSRSRQPEKEASEPQTVEGVPLEILYPHMKPEQK